MRLRSASFNVPCKCASESAKSGVHLTGTDSLGLLKSEKAWFKLLAKVGWQAWLLQRVAEKPDLTLVVLLAELRA